MEHLDKNEGIADELSTVGKGMNADCNPEDGTIRDLETQIPTSLGTPLTTTSQKKNTLRAASRRGYQYSARSVE
jgi:hypothetical protein